MPTTRLPELALGDGDLFGAALLSPAYTPDLSTWTVTIHKHGLLTQTVLLTQPPSYDEQLTVLRQRVRQEHLDRLKQIVQEESLLTFGTFPSVCMTDQEHTRLIIHLFGQTISIDAYAPHAVSEYGESAADKEDARRYCRLWDAILELTPFSPYRG